MSSLSIQIEHLIVQLGGCGVVQVLICIAVHCSISVTVFSMISMSFMGYDPGFNCHKLSVDRSSLPDLNISTFSTDSMCSVGQNAFCIEFVFLDGMETVVSEWDLVCNKSWIVALIISIQMVGVVVGTVTGGQLAESLGRKPCLIIGTAVTTIFNLVAYFTVSWQMYSAVRFFIGIGVGFFFAVHFTLMVECVPSSWRAFVVCIPSEPLFCTLFALSSWLLHSWKILHLFITYTGINCLICLSLVPESFRWLVTKTKLDRAEKLFHLIAKVNGVSKPKLEDIFETAKVNVQLHNSSRHMYTLFSLWKLKQFRNVTVSLSLLWLVISMAWHCMILAMESIPATIYMSIFLLGLVDLLAYLITERLVNRFGRKKFICIGFCVTGILCFLSGLFQHIEKVLETTMAFRTSTLVMSLLAKMHVSMVFIALAVYTTELYPTVLRTIGYSFHSTMGKIGAVASGLLIYVDELVPGAMYFICGILICLCTINVKFLRETKDVALVDFTEENG